MLNRHFVLCGGISCLLLLAVAEAPAAPNSTAAVVSRSLPIGVESKLGIQTLPNASCTLNLPTQASTIVLKLFANGRGIVHFTMQPLVADTVTLSLQCADGTGASQTVPIQVTTSAGAVDVNSDTAVTIPDVGVVQEPLGPDPMSITEAQLRAAKYPPRPDPVNAPAKYQQWAKMVTSRNTRIEDVIPRPNEPRFNPLQTDVNWGVGAEIPSTGQLFIDTQSWWVVPHTTPDLHGPVGDVAFWNGLYAQRQNNSATLAKAGVDQQVYCQRNFLANAPTSIGRSSLG